jgi:hypothetical protein
MFRYNSYVPEPPYKTGLRLFNLNSTAVSFIAEALSRLLISSSELLPTEVLKVNATSSAVNFSPSVNLTSFSMFTVHVLPSGLTE